MEAIEAITPSPDEQEMWDILRAIEHCERNGTDFELEAGAKLPGEIPSGYR